MGARRKWTLPDWTGLRAAFTCLQGVAPTSRRQPAAVNSTARCWAFAPNAIRALAAALGNSNRSLPVMAVDESKRRLLDDLFDTIDELNVDRFLHFLTDDAIFRFGSAEPAHGQVEIRAAVNDFFASIAGCKHTLNNILAGNGTLACEGEVTYTRHDGTEITLPFANIFEFEGEHIAHYKIYADAAPLYAEEEQVVVGVD
jgi:limonene-1,2-epoxide hydrolase